MHSKSILIINDELLTGIKEVKKIKKQTNIKIIIPLLFLLLALTMGAVSAAEVNTTVDSPSSNELVLIEISGQVEQCSDGEPFQGATVTVSDNGSQVASTTTGADGTYSTSFQSMNRVFTVTANANGHQPSTKTVTANNNQGTYTGTANFQLGNNDAYVYQGWTTNPDEDYTFSDGTTIHLTGATNAFTTINDGITYATGNPGVNTVYIAPGTYNEYSMSIDTSVNLHGENQDTTIIDADDNARILTIWNGATVNIEQLTFRDGASEYGGALRVESGTTTITDCTFDSNTVTDYGGAIYVDPGATTTITGTTFTDNTAVDGGAIYNDGGVLDFNGCTFTGNSASSTNYGGGAIFNSINGGTVNLSDCIFTSNTAEFAGGAIYNRYNLTVENCTFTSNTASSYGGAISGGRGNNTITGCTFNGNTASYGGAIAVGTADTCTVNGCTFIGNSATTLGGAIYSQPIITANFNRFYSNQASQGSAISASQTSNIENNWWGLNNPISSFTSLIQGVSPPTQWLYMTISANPTTINNGVTSLITVSFNNYSSDGTTYTEFDPSIGHIPDGTPVTFSLTNGPFGTLTPPLTIYTVNGTASILFTATNTGIQEVNATTDNQTCNVSIPILGAHAELEKFYADYNEFANNNYHIVPITDPVNYLDRVVVVLKVTNMGPDPISLLQLHDDWPTDLVCTNELWSSRDTINWGFMPFYEDKPFNLSVSSLNNGVTQWIVIGATVNASNKVITNNITTISQTPTDFEGFDTASANLEVNPATYVEVYKKFRNTPWGQDITTAHYNDVVYAMVQVQNTGPDSTFLTVLDTLTGITWTGNYYVLSGSINPSDPDNWMHNDPVNTFDGTQWNIPTFSSFIGGNVKWLAIEGIINQVGTASNYAEVISQGAYPYQGFDNYTATITTTITPTNLTVADARGDKDHTVTLSAVLTDYLDNPLNGETVEFWIDSTKVGEGITDATGKATFDYLISQTGGNHELKAIFNGTPLYQASEATGQLYVPSADLYIVITSNPKNPNVGEMVTLTYKLGNNGPDDAENVTITIPVPEGFVVDKIEGDGTWTYDPTTRTITWTMANVTVGDPYLYITGRFTRPGSYLFTASINSNTYNINTQGVSALTVNAQNVVEAKTISMQETGAPIAPILLAILLVIGGLVVPSRK